MSTLPFTFPLSRQQYESVETMENLRQVLKREAQSFAIWKDTYKVESKHEKRYVYAKCRHCKAVLRYKWDAQQHAYTLRLFNNQHVHLYQQQTNQQLFKFISDLPIGVDLKTARDIAMKQLNVSSSKFYHAYSRIKRNRSVLPDLIKQLERKDYYVASQPFPIEPNMLPEILLVFSPQMKKLFKEYGQVVSYDLTYNLIQERDNNNHQYAVGIFTGVNCYNRIIPFGITITCLETTDAFGKIFETFIQANGSPQSFITDEQQGMIGGIKRLNDMGIFDGTHLFDSFHVIRNFGKTSGRKDILGQVSDIIREESSIKFEMKMEDLQAKMKKESELHAFQLFSKKVTQVCFSQLRKDSFVIFNASNSINEKMNDLIKCRIRSQKPYTQVLRIITQFAEVLIESSQGTIQLYDFRVEGLFDDSNLKIMRFLLAKRPMEEFLKQYVSSLTLKPPQKNRNRYLFQEKYSQFQCYVEEQGYQCSCGYQQKTGIGCRHMLYVCREKEDDYLKTIHPRWKFDKKPPIVISIKRPRKTRKRV